jgi:hypothetical protein
VSGFASIEPKVATFLLLFLGFRPLFIFFLLLFFSNAPLLLNSRHFELSRRHRAHIIYLIRCERGHSSCQHFCAAAAPAPARFDLFRLNNRIKRLRQKTVAPAHFSNMNRKTGKGDWKF